jgi:hypothetical protein
MKIVPFKDAKDLPLKVDLTPEELAEAYRLIQDTFTAADLAEYCNIDERDYVDMDEMMADLDTIQNQHDERKQ